MDKHTMATVLQYAHCLYVCKVKEENMHKINLTYIEERIGWTDERTNERTKNYFLCWFNLFFVFGVAMDSRYCSEHGRGNKAFFSSSFSSLFGAVLFQAVSKTDSDWYVDVGCLHPPPLRFYLHFSFTWWALQEIRRKKQPSAPSPSTPSAYKPKQHTARHHIDSFAFF